MADPHSCCRIPILHIELFLELEGQNMNFLIRVIRVTNICVNIFRSFSFFLEPRLNNVCVAWQSPHIFKFTYFISNSNILFIPRYIMVVKTF